MQFFKMRKRVAVALLGCACAVAVASSSAYAGSRATASASKAPWVIAVPGSLSGPLEGSSVPGIAGVQAAANYFNSLGGVDGHKFKVTVYDDQSSLTIDPAAGQQAVASNPVVIMDTGGSAGVTARLPIYESAKIPVVAEAVSEYFPWLYGNTPTPEQTSAATLTMAKAGLHVKSLKGKTAAYVVADTANGVVQANLIPQLFAAQGGKVVDAVLSPLGAATFVGASNVIADHPDIVLLADSNPDDILETNTLKSDGYTGPIVANFGGDSTATLQTLGSGYAAQWFAPEVLPKSSIAYKWAVKDNVVTDTGSFGYETFFASMYLVAKGLGLCKYPCPPAKLEKALTKLGPLNIRGVAYGEYGVGKGKDHTLLRAYELWTYKNGKFQNFEGKNSLPIPFGPPNYAS